MIWTWRRKEGSRSKAMLSKWSITIRGRSMYSTWLILRGTWTFRMRCPVLLPLAKVHCWLSMHRREYRHRRSPTCIWLLNTTLRLFPLSTNAIWPVPCRRKWRMRLWNCWVASGKKLSAHPVRRVWEWKKSWQPLSNVSRIPKGMRKHRYRLWFSTLYSTLSVELSLISRLRTEWSVKVTKWSFSIPARSMTPMRWGYWKWN